MTCSCRYSAALTGLALCLALAGCAPGPPPPPVEGPPPEEPVLSVEEILAEADSSLEAGRVGEAASLYGQVLEQEPASFAANLGTGLALLAMEEGKFRNQRDYTIIRQHFEAARAARPEDPRPYAFLGRISFDEEDYTGAIRHLTSAARLGPDDAETAELLGLALAETGRTDEARGELHRALSIDPSLAEANLALGKIYEKAGDNSRARDYLEKALSENPNLHLATYYLQRVYYEEKLYGRAEDRCKEFLEFYPDDIQSLEILGNIYRLEDRDEEVFEVYSRLTRIEPANTSYWSPVIQYLTDRKDYEAAKPVLEEALRHNPYYAYGNVHYAKILMHFAREKEVTGEFTEAIDLYRLALAHLEKAQVDDRYVRTAISLSVQAGKRIDLLEERR